MPPPAPPLAAVHAWMVVYRKANQLATGLVVLFLAIGATDLFGTSYTSSEVNGFHNINIPVLGHIPGIGPILFDHDPLVYIFLSGRARRCGGSSSAAVGAS